MRLRRFGVVLLAGFVGGALCGFLILLPQELGMQHIGVVENLAQRLLTNIEFSAGFGIEFGGAFGLVAFPLCYYLLLRRLPLNLSLAITIPGTVVVGWLAYLIPIYSNAFNLSELGLWWFGLIYGPGLAGLLVSSIALSVWGRRTRVRTDQSRP